jgi:crotonobetainyl-CoA:carnitine CoA-transferase CaiB-like acyl-CoA transferase
MLLADWGADVIKVEEPSKGDALRDVGNLFIGGQSAIFLEVNRGKRSLTADLRKPEGQEVVRRLAISADVFIQNFKPGTIERYNLSYDTLSRVNRGLVYCSISAFGLTGPDAPKPGLDPVIQARAGLMSLTGEEDRPPVVVGAPYGDTLAAMSAFQGILLALRQRESTGMGQHVSVAMLDAMLASLAPRGQIQFVTGESPRRHGSAHPNVAPYQAFRCRDGYLVIAAVSDKFWLRLLECLDLEHLRSDERFSTNANRVEHRKALCRIIESITTTQRRSTIQSLLEERGIPTGPVHDLDEVVNDPQTIHNAMVRELAHPTAGVYKIIGSPIKLSDSVATYSPSPELGEATTKVMTELGYTDQDIHRLRQDGVI